MSFKAIGHSLKSRFSLLDFLMSSHTPNPMIHTEPMLNKHAEQIHREDGSVDQLSCLPLLKVLAHTFPDRSKRMEAMNSVSNRNRL